MKPPEKETPGSCETTGGATRGTYKKKVTYPYSSFKKYMEVEVQDGWGCPAFIGLPICNSIVELGEILSRLVKLPAYDCRDDLDRAYDIACHLANSYPKSFLVKLLKSRRTLYHRIAMEIEGDNRHV